MRNWRSGDFWEMLTPSQFAQWTGAMENFAEELGVPGAKKPGGAIRWSCCWN